MVTYMVKSTVSRDQNTIIGLLAFAIEYIRFKSVILEYYYSAIKESESVIYSDKV
jgi:hypothetical protein